MKQKKPIDQKPYVLNFVLIAVLAFFIIAGLLLAPVIIYGIIRVILGV